MLIGKQAVYRCAVLSVPALIFALGCSTHFSEKYYVGTYERSEGKGRSGPTQFYRFKLDGYSTLGCNTKYEAGWYDARVIDRLFGELKPKSDTQQGSSTTPPVAPSGVTFDIPALFVADEAKDGGASLALTNAELSDRVKTPSVPLEKFSELHASHLTMTVKPAKDGQNCSIESIEPVGEVELTFKNENVPEKLLQSASWDAVPSGDKAELKATMLKEMHVSGGEIRLHCADTPVPTGTTWSGNLKNATSESPYHSFSWSGGKFQLRGGVVKSSLGYIQANGADATFTPLDKSVIDLTATSGWLLRMGNATLRKNDTSVRLKTTLKAGTKFVDMKGGPLVLQTVEDALNDSDKEKLAKSCKGKSGAKETTTLELSNSISIKLPALAELLNPATDSPAAAGTSPTPAPSAAVSPGIANASVEHFTVTDGTIVSGNFEITTTHAVESATAAGQGVVFKDANRRVFLHFGPEAWGSAQRDDERFAIFMSSSPRVLVNRIRSLVNAERTQNVIATAVIAPKRAEEERSLSASKVSTEKAKNFAKQAMAVVNSDEFKNKMTNDDMKRQIGSWLGALGGDPTGIVSSIISPPKPEARQKQGS